MLFLPPLTNETFLVINTLVDTVPSERITFGNKEER